MTSISACRATTFRLVPVDMGAGWSMTGTLETDGTLGGLTAANVTSWRIVVKCDTDLVYDRGNTGNLSANVYSDGVRLLVPTSPDGFSDGGMLAFYQSVYNQVRVADFTGAYVDGGIALYSKGSAFDMVPLGQPNGSMYEAGRIDPLNQDVYVLNPVQFLNDTVLFGQVKTDGTVGLTRVLDWSVTVRSTWSFVFSPSNSHVLSNTGISTDGHTLVVRPHDQFGNGNEFAIGFGTVDRTMALLADFSWMPEGQAGYLDPFGLYTLSPLPLNVDGDYIVATATGPETLAPVAERVLLGSLKSGSLASWTADDGDARRVCKFFVPTMTSPVLRADLDFVTSKTAPVSLDFIVKGRAVNAGTFRLRTYVQDKKSSTLVEAMADAPLTSTYAEFHGSPSGNLSDFVGTGGLMTGRIEVRQTGPGSAMLPCFDFEFAQFVVAD